jgi:hypothetical protein
MADQERANPKPKDIPDVNSKGPVDTPMEPEVQQERTVRRYIRKDGMFRKDLKWLDTEDTGELDLNGDPVKKPGYTEIQATKIAVETIKASGRGVEKDPATGRLKAVPGWNLDIRVPGFGVIEQKAPKEPQGKIREEINDRALRDLQKQNEKLQEQLDKLAGKAESAETGKGKGK